MILKKNAIFNNNIKQKRTRKAIKKQKDDKKRPANLLVSIGVTRFELATSASLRRRSNQTEPHPVTRILLYNSSRIKSSVFFNFFNFLSKKTIIRPGRTSHILPLPLLRPRLRSLPLLQNLPISRYFCDLHLLSAIHMP